MKVLFICLILLIGVIALTQAESHLVRSLTSAGSLNSALNSSPHRGLFVKFYAPWCGHCKSIAPIWEQLAERFPDSVAEVNCDDFKSFCQDYSVSGYPTLRYFAVGEPGNGEDYRGARDFDGLSQFLAQKLGIRLPQPPTDVITADDSSFNQLVLQTPVHSFVEFYAPWCGHCKNLAPTWEKLATIFKNEPNVDIVKIDADANRESTQPFGISGFPTLKFFPAGQKSQPEDYENGHDLESLVAFVNAQAGTHRKADGSLNSQAGLHPILDSLAKQFIEPNADKASIRAQAAEVDVEEPFIKKLYLLVMDRLTTNPNFAEQELVRVSRMLQSGSVNPLKADEFYKRMNIISSFISDN